MTTTAQPLLSSITQHGDRVTIHVEDVYPTTIDDLWDAVTSPARLARWIATVTGDLQPGGAFHVTFTSTWDGPGRVEACDPPYGYSLVMEPGTPQEGRIAVRLTEEGDSTRLVVEDFGIPAAEQLAHGAGWQVHLEDLRSHIDGREPTPWRTRWQALMPDYRAQLGAAVEGPRLIGSMRTVDGAGAVRMMETFDTDIDDLWSALTEPARLARWLGVVEGSLEPGGEFHSHLYAGGATGDGRVVECDRPYRFLVETWSDDASASRRVTEAVLTEAGDQTTLTIEQRGLPVEMLPAYGAGLQIHVEDLAAHLAGDERCDSDARIAVLYPAYQQVSIIE